MAKCRYCAKSGWTVRTNKNGLCRECGTSVRLDIETKLAQLKEALVYVRCSSQPQTQLSFCDVALEAVKKLAVYERRRLADVRPKPSAVIEMLEARRQEALDECGPVRQTTRSLGNGGAVLRDIAPPRREPPRPTEAVATPEPPESPASEESPAEGWWAWGPNVVDFAGEEGAADLRTTHRTSVDCYALLNPGGVRGRLENLSAGGLFLRASEVLPVGSPVRLIVSTAYGPATATGVVRWARGSGEEQRAESGMGIEFTDISPELATYLSSQLIVPLRGIESDRTSVAL